MRSIQQTISIIDLTSVSDKAAVADILFNKSAAALHYQMSIVTFKFAGLLEDKSKSKVCLTSRI